MTQSAHAADVRAYPEWSSDQVRAARSGASSTALVFDVQSTVRVDGQPDKVVSETIALAPSFIFVDTAEEQVLDDGDLCRTFTWVKGGSTFHSESCYAAPAFRTFELMNRQNLQRLLQAAKIKDTPLDASPYWREAELGVQPIPSDPLARLKSDEAMDYELNGETVVRVGGSTTPFQSDEARRFVRFTALHTQLHPEVRRDLLGALSLPRTLEVTGEAALKRRHETIVISNVRRATISYPLPPGLTSELRTKSQRADILQQTGISAAIGAIDGRPSTPKPTLNDLERAAKAADSAHRPLDVLLLFMEVTQEYGPSLMTSPEGVKVLRDNWIPLINKAVLDPETARFMAVSNLSGASKAPADRQAAASFLAAIKMDDRPYGTFKNVTFANLVRGAGDTSKWNIAILKSMPSPLADNYWVHIAAHPWSSFTYKDAGDAYLQAFNVSEAWVAYDLGREIDKDWRLSTMQALSTLEDQLRAKLPDFF